MTAAVYSIDAATITDHCRRIFTCVGDGAAILRNIQTVVTVNGSNERSEEEIAAGQGSQEVNWKQWPWVVVGR